MKNFNVIVYDFNNKKFITYDIIPYLVRKVKESKEKPVSFEEFKDFIEKESMCQFWSRCEYEMILKNWPNQNVKEKWDVYDQIIMNLDVIVNLVIESI